MNKINRTLLAKHIILKRLLYQRSGLAEVSAKTGVNYATLVAVERQEIDPTPRVLLLLCTWLGVDREAYFETPDERLCYYSDTLVCKRWEVINRRCEECNIDIRFCVTRNT